MKLNNKELKNVMQQLSELAKDERLGRSEKNALQILSDFTFKVASENFGNKIDEYTKEKEKLRTDFIVYCRCFQQYDMDRKRDIEEIESIVEAVPHNQGFVRNSIIFAGTFDFLLENIDYLNEQIVLLKKGRTDEQYSLSDFINFAFVNE